MLSPCAKSSSAFYLSLRFPQRHIPVRPQFGFGSGQIPRRQRRQNPLVAFIAVVKGLRFLEKAVFIPAGLKLQLVRKFHQIGISCQAAEGVVEFVIGAAGVLGSSDFDTDQEGLVKGRQPFHIFRGNAGAGQLQRHCLKTDKQLVNMAHILFVNGGNISAAGGYHPHQLLLAEELYGLPHRGTGDGKILGQLHIVQPFPGLHCPIDDPLPQGAVDPLFGGGAGGSLPSEEKRIRLASGGQEFWAVLFDTPAANDLYEMLPLELTLEDFNGTEKIGYLPSALITEGEPEGCDPGVGALCYYAPWENISIFYEDFRYSDSLVSLGRLESGADWFGGQSGSFEVTIERAD